MYHIIAGNFVIDFVNDFNIQKLFAYCCIRCNTGLQSLARELLHVEMDKAFHVQCGNWEAETLNERQVSHCTWERCSFVLSKAFCRCLFNARHACA